MRRFARQIGKKVLCGVLNPIYSGLGTIVCLHRVVPPSKTPRLPINTALEISPESLETLVQRVIADGYRIISMNEVHNILVTRKSAGKFAAFSFDDGYTEMLHVVAPLFRKYSAPFCVNIAPGLVEKMESLWWYRVEELLLKNSSLVYEAENGTCELQTQTPGEKARAFDKLSSRIRGCEYGERDEFLAKVFQVNQLPAATSREIMTWDEIRQLSKDPLVTIGAHTINHYDCTRLTEQQLLEEINGSRSIVESQIGKKVEHFAYPFGRPAAVNKRELAISRTCNFKTMATTRSANIFPEHVNHLECLPRTTISGNYPIKDRWQLMRTGALAAVGYRFKRVITVE